MKKSKRKIIDQRRKDDAKAKRINSVTTLREPYVPDHSLTQKILQPRRKFDYTRLEGNHVTMLKLIYAFGDQNTIFVGTLAWLMNPKCESWTKFGKLASRSSLHEQMKSRKARLPREAPGLSAIRALAVPMGFLKKSGHIYEVSKGVISLTRVGLKYLEQAYGNKMGLLRRQGMEHVLGKLLPVREVTPLTPISEWFDVT